MLFCFQKENILEYVRNILEQQQQTLLDATQHASKQWADMRMMLLDMQHQVNQTEGKARQVVTNATKQNFAALQYVQQHSTASCW